ncbi:MAG TPA: hypothetical protein VK024_03540 [Actinomycetaceae bacterium]|nr:hypothetical protein [Actinomycetaceae bacterium]
MPDDLVIDEAYLLELASDLENVAGELENLCTGLRSMEGLVVGAPTLFDKMTSFADAWSRCGEDLAEYADGGAQQVRAILDAFSQVDAELGNAMQGGAGLEMEVK